MKLLEIRVERLLGVADGGYSFADASGHPRDLVVLAGAGSTALLATIAALIEAVRVPGPAPHRLAWWATRRGPEEARLCARWALSEAEAARASLSARTAVSEWRLGQGDRLPREVQVEGALPRRARADLGRYVFLDAKRISVWMEADPLTELLAGIARRDVGATRVYCRMGVGIVGASTPDTFTALNRLIARVFPALRLERVGCGQGEAPVACFRDGERVELDQLPEVERDAIHLAATIHTANVRDGVVLVDRPDLHVPHEARGQWLDWLAGLAGTNQLLLSASSAELTGARTTKQEREGLVEYDVAGRLET